MNVKILFSIFINSCIVLIIISCAHANSTPENNSVTLVFDFSKVFLDEENLHTRIISAKNGCVDSAFILYFHYNTSRDYEESIKWLKIATDGGHPIAVFHNTFDDEGLHWRSSSSAALLSPIEIKYLLELIEAGNEKAYVRLVRHYAYHDPDKLPLENLPETLSGYRFFMDGRREGQPESADENR
ncbi:MAG: hypothetical protein JJU29_23970 [Verrucomicrobia bacterium]|nr:hypothetical protein [Verrucomicrobiota bacterium]